MQNLTFITKCVSTGIYKRVQPCWQCRDVVLTCERVAAEHFSLIVFLTLASSTLILGI